MKVGHHGGLGQFKTVAWKLTTKDDEFKHIWKVLCPGHKIPEKPGKSPTADILAIAVWTKMREDDLDIIDLGNNMDKARRLIYHLSDDAAFDKIKQLIASGKVAFADAPNQTNWDQFCVVLEKAKPTEMVAGIK